MLSATATHRSLDLSRTAAVLLAGGQGTRLHELTAAECKPALPFAGNFRIIDFSMANAVRSGIDRLIVATQYRPETLHRHLMHSWADQFGDGNLLLRDGNLVKRGGYGGTADAVAANIAEIDALGVDEVVILAGDHIYAMDYRPMIAMHRAAKAKVTIAASTVSVADAHAFGVIVTDAQSRIMRFLEKPAHPVPMPDERGKALISLGIYVFDWAWLRAALCADAANVASSHDFGHDILPEAVARAEAFAFVMPKVAGAAPYWRDVGTLDAYRLAQLDFASDTPPCALPGVRARPAASALRAVDTNIVLGGRTEPGPGSHTVLAGSVVLPGACVMPGARLSRTIVAPRGVVPAGLVIGEDPEEDARWFRRTENGTTLVTAEMIAARQAGHRLRHTVRSMNDGFQTRIA